MTAPVAVFGIGNRSRGDDALGPALLDRLAAWLEARGLGGGFELLEAYQLQVENALDLEGRELALFIDAWRDAPGAAVLTRLAPAVTAASCCSHNLEPAEVLGVHRRVTGREPPPAFALAVRAERFELGEGLSAASRRALDEAWPLLELLATDPRLASWQARAATPRQEETPMANRKSPAATKSSGSKAPVAPKEGAKLTRKKQGGTATTGVEPEEKAPAATEAGAKAATAKVPAGRVPAARTAAAKAPAARARKAPPRSPAPPEPDRILMVAEAAYYLAERRGFAPGNELEDWLAAEEEIVRRLAGR